MATIFSEMPVIYLAITAEAFLFAIPVPTLVDGIASARAPVVVGTLLMSFAVDGEGESRKPLTTSSMNMTMKVDGVAETENPVTETGPTSTLMKLTGIA